MSINSTGFPEYDQEINSSQSSFQNSQVGQAGHDLNQHHVTNNVWMDCLVQARHTVNKFFHISCNAISPKASSFLQNATPQLVENNPDLIKEQTQYLSELTNISYRQLELTKSRTERMVSIKAEQVQLKKQEISLKSNFFNRKTNLIKECHEENIKLKLQEIEATWDSLHLPLIFNRNETINFVRDRVGNLCILLAPPKIPSYIQGFEHLVGDIDHEINDAITKFFVDNEVHYPIRFYRLFKRDILPPEATLIRDILSPVSTVIFSSEITDREVRIVITYPTSKNSVNSNISGDNQIRLEPWNWKNLQVELEHNGVSSEDSIFSIRKLISILHQVLAVYFSDLYCLSIDPYHDPKLFILLGTVNLPNTLSDWASPYRTSLLEIQKQLREREADINHHQEVNSYKNIGYSHESDWGFLQVIGVGIAILFGLGFCSQTPQQQSNRISYQQESVPAAEQSIGIIQAGDNYSGASLRKFSDATSQQIKVLSNGTEVMLGDLSSDGKWQKVTTQEGLEGWVTKVAIERQ